MRDYASFRAAEFCAKKKVPKISLKKGDVVVESEPFAYVIDTEKRGQYCEYCFSRGRSRTLFPCKNCGFPFYCSDGCMQQSYDEYHKRECSSLKRAKSTNKNGEPVPNFARLLARIIFKLKDGGDRIEEKYCVNRGRKFKDLMNHYKDIKNDKNRMQDALSLMDILKDYMGEENVPNESDFIGIYGRALVNRFCLNDESNISMGSAVFLAASIFDHSCMPNAHPSFIGKKLSIRTLVDLPELNLDKVRICYIDCVNGTEMRQQELFKNWYFWCDCDLCNSDERKHYENYIVCETPNCNEHITIPERYSKIEPTEDIKNRSEEDSATALKNALQAAKVQYNFANVPVNPFASTDAMMSYLFYDKDRYKLADDSDLTECTDDDSSSLSNTPTRQKSPEPAETNGAPVNNVVDTETDNITISLSTSPLTNGAGGTDHTEQTLDEEEKVEADSSLAKAKNKMSKSVPEDKNKTGSAKSNGLVNGASEEISSSTEKSSDDLALESKKVAEQTKDITPPISKDKDSEKVSDNFTGTRTKTLNKKKKSLKNDDTEESENDDGYKYDTVSNGIATQLTNGSSDHLVSECVLTNGYAAEDEQDNNEAAKNGTEDKKKKKLVRRHVFEQSDVMCKKCEVYVDRNTLREYRSAITFTIERLKDMKEESPNFPVVLDVMDRQGTLIPKHNVWRVRTLDFAFNAAFGNGAWVLAMKYGMENLEGMKYLYCNYHPTLGLFYMKMSKIYMTLKLHRQGLVYVMLAKDIISTAMGPKHPFVTGQLNDLEMMANEDPDILIEKRLAKMKEQVTEIICSCCGKKKIIQNYAENIENEKPWEKDRQLNKEMQEDSMFFNTDDYRKIN